MLLQREDVFVEILLKLLIGKVDIELLEAIDREVFKAKDVQDASEGKVVLSTTNTNIDLL